MTTQPRVGIGVFVFNSEGMLILGKRKGSHGSGILSLNPTLPSSLGPLMQTGTWALPGGHLEHGESFEACAQREVLEETGLHASDIHFLTATNSILEEGAHYVTIFMGCMASELDAQPRVSSALDVGFGHV